jgi:hypothetical protein
MGEAEAGCFSENGPADFAWTRLQLTLKTLGYCGIFSLSGDASFPGAFPETACAINES